MRYYLIIIISLQIITNCISLKKQRKRPMVITQNEKFNTSVSKTQSKSLSEKALIDFYDKHIKSSKNLDFNELEYLKVLSKKNGITSNLKEAVKAILVIKKNNIYHKKLEDQASINSLDIKSQLANNPYLSNAKFQLLALNVLSKGSDTEQYKASLRAIILQNVDKWEEVKSELANSNPISSSEENMQSVDESDLQSSEELNVSNDSDILSNAQTLADQYEYFKAINLLKKISSSSSYYETAQENIITYSNSGVKQYRRQAATSYRNSNQVSKDSVRLEYLEKAKNFLNLAMMRYPLSTSLEKLKENIAVIEKNIFAIKEKSNKKF